MKRSLALALGLLLLVPLPPAVAKEKAKAASGSKVTEADLLVCTGVSSAPPIKQIEVCTKILNSGKVKHPFQADYLATRAAAYFAQRDLDKALADLNKAIGVRQAPEFYMQRGLVFRAKFEWDAAKADLEKVIALKPEFAHAHFMRGIIAYELVEYQDALKYFDASIARAESNYSALFARGVVRKRLGDERAGDADIAKARGMSPKVDELMARLGIRA